MFAKEWSKMKINIDVINIGYGKCQQPREHMVSPFPRKKKTTSPFPNYEKNKDTELGTEGAENTAYTFALFLAYCQFSQF